MKTPKGKLTIDHVEIKQLKDIACYFDIYVKDEDGNIFTTKSSCFLFDLCLVSELHDIGGMEKV